MSVGSDQFPKGSNQKLNEFMSMSDEQQKAAISNVSIFLLSTPSRKTELKNT